MNREPVDLTTLRLPPSSIPRPGDTVTWYQSRQRHEGVLLGHHADGRPIVRSTHGFDLAAQSFETIRLTDPSRRIGPNWMTMPETSAVVRPTEAERRTFEGLLAQRTPPGPQYIDLVQEIAERGFEVFLVGGTVRDVISGKPSKDVDLVTTMPLSLALPLAFSMYGSPRRLEEGAQRNGHLRLGGRLGSLDPFIDLCVFKHSCTGTADAIFGSSFEYDLKNRDFACNAVYYDPMNNALFDPCGIGIGDAEEARLSIIADFDLRTSFQIGQIGIRLFKFLSRGFSLACSEREVEYLIAHMHGMGLIERLRYTRTQIVSKYPPEQRATQVEKFREAFAQNAPEDAWPTLIEPLVEELLQ